MPSKATGNKVGTGPSTPVASETPAKTGPSSNGGSKGKPDTTTTTTTPPKAKARKPGAPAAAYAAFGKASSAKKMVLFGVAMAGVAVVLRDLKSNRRPSLRLGVGVLFAGIFLSALADVIPEVAGPLGLLILVGAFVIPGPHGEPSVGSDLIRSVQSIGK